jgi:hypothetical protein
MTIQVPAAAYAAYARGEITGEELLSLEKTAAVLNKNASAPGALTPQNIAALGGLALAAPTLAYLGAKVPEAIEGTFGAMTFNRDLRRVVEVNPQLGSPDDPNLRMAFKTLRSTNPEYSKDPLIAGTILDMVMTNRVNPDDPTSAPRYDPALLQSIQQKTKAPRDYAAEAASKATAGAAVKFGLTDD